VTRTRPEKKREPRATAGTKILPMELQVGDRLTDETVGSLLCRRELYGYETRNW